MSSFDQRISRTAEDEEGPSIKLKDGLEYAVIEDGNKQLISQIHPTKHIQFAQIGTYLRMPRLCDISPNLVSPDNIDIIAVGIPFDNGCSFRSGARFGPTSIRESSRIIEYPFEHVQCCDGGDISITPYNLDLAMKQMYNGILDNYLNKYSNCKLAIMGGDHTLSFPMLNAFYNFYNKNKKIILIHFDAHLDTYNKSMDQDVWHGSPFRKAYELGIIDTKHSMHVGVREHCGTEKEFNDSKNMGYHCITTEEIHENGINWTVDQILHRLGLTDATSIGEKENSSNEDLPLVYLSTDIDVLDPSVAPGTGTPESGGLFSHQLFSIFRKMAKTMADKINIIACDMVEVSPAWDNNANITGLAAAHVLYQMMLLMEANCVAMAEKKNKNGKNGKNADLKRRVILKGDVRAKL